MSESLRNRNTGTRNARRIAVADARRAESVDTFQTGRLIVTAPVGCQGGERRAQAVAGQPQRPGALRLFGLQVRGEWRPHFGERGDESGMHQVPV